MRNLISILLLLSISACSVRIIEMAARPTVQKIDLADSEGDGVINARDLCRQTVAGALVNNSGCGSEHMETVIYELQVNFANNSYFIEPKYMPAIRGLADYLKEFTETKVTIEGHTSKLGSKALNKTLSENRAQAIKSILVSEFTIDEHRVTPVGYGSERPLEEGDDDYAHKRNNRIVADLSVEKSFSDMKWTIYSVDERTE